MPAIKQNVATDLAEGRSQRRFERAKTPGTIPACWHPGGVRKVPVPSYPMPQLASIPLPPFRCPFRCLHSVASFSVGSIFGGSSRSASATAWRRRRCERWPHHGMDMPMLWEGKRRGQGGAAGRFKSWPRQCRGQASVGATVGVPTGVFTMSDAVPRAGHPMVTNRWQRGGELWFGRDRSWATSVARTGRKRASPVKLSS